MPTKAQWVEHMTAPPGSDYCCHRAGRPEKPEYPECDGQVVDITDEEMDARRKAWVAPPFKYTRGRMYRYIKTVSSAQKGCVTDE